MAYKLEWREYLGSKEQMDAVHERNLERDMSLYFVKDTGHNALYMDVIVVLVIVLVCWKFLTLTLRWSIGGQLFRLLVLQSDDNANGDANQYKTAVRKNYLHLQSAAEDKTRIDTWRRGKQTSTVFRGSLFLYA